MTGKAEDLGTTEPAGRPFAIGEGCLDGILGCIFGKTTLAGQTAHHRADRSMGKQVLLLGDKGCNVFGIAHARPIMSTG